MTVDWTTMEEINQYESKHLDPARFPDETFEMYSVPCYDDRVPELVRGKEIGSSKQVVEEGDVLLCKINPRINRVWSVGAKKRHRMIASSEWIVVRTKAYLPKYLQYYFSSPRFRQRMEAKTAGIGGSLTRVQPKVVKTFPVPVTKKEEQAHVVARMDALCAAIENRTRVLRLLDELVRARFVEMFGDPFLNEKLFPVYELSKIATSRLGKMLDAKKQTGKNTFPYLANYNVQWFRFDLEELHQMDFEPAEQKEFELKKGDLLVCEGCEVGRCAIWDGKIKNCFFQKALHRVRCDTSVILPEYLAYTFFWHSQFNGFEDAISGVSTIAHLPGARLRKLKIIVPPLSLQHAFAAFVRATDAARSAVRRQVAALETLRAREMQACFGGV